MKRFALVGVGMAAGFTAAVMLFPTAHGANDPRPIASSIFSAMRSSACAQNYVRPVDDSQLVTCGHPRHGVLARSAFELYGREGLRRHADPDQRPVRAVSASKSRWKTASSKSFRRSTTRRRRSAGIKTGDFIAAVDGTPIQGMSLDDAIDKMRGTEGTKVTITVLRTGTKKPFDVDAHARDREGRQCEIPSRRRCRLYPAADPSTSRPMRGSSMRCAN